MDASMSALIDHKDATCSSSQLPTMLIILPWNSFGLQQDADIYDAALGGCARIVLAHQVSPPRDASDAVWLFLEHSPSEKLSPGWQRGWKRGVASRERWLMANLEHAFTRTLRNPELKLILCKTRIVCELLVRFRSEFNTTWDLTYTKFSSTDRFGSQPRGSSADYSRFLHVAGQSPLKQTREVLDAWHAHPEWPLLTIVHRGTSAGPGTLAAKLRAYRGGAGGQRAKRGAQPGPANVRLVHDVSTGALTRLQSSIGVHLCPSVTEGYGHYINEACELRIPTRDLT